MIRKELVYKTSRSGGKGGQNVNKVETKVALFWDVLNSGAIDDKVKTKLTKKLPLTSEGEFIVTCEETRSQLQNKEIAEKKLYDKLQDALKPVKVRKKKHVSAVQKKKRLEDKKKASEKKERRKRIDP